MRPGSRDRKPQIWLGRRPAVEITPIMKHSGLLTLQRTVIPSRKLNPKQNHRPRRASWVNGSNNSLSSFRIYCCRALRN